MFEQFSQNEVSDRRLQGIMTLADVTCELARLLDTQAIFECVVKGICSALECERASLFFFDDDRRELFTRTTTELEISEIRVALDDGVVGWAASELQLVNIPDPSVDARWNSAFDESTGFQTRSILATPVVSARDERLLGVVQALNRDGGPFNEFDEQMLRAFAAHVATALQRAELLAEAQAAHEMKVSIGLARRIQTNFLPRALPGLTGYEIASWWDPADSVSGDYYDVLPLPNGQIGLVIADVTGHGVGPSLIMAAARAMLHVLSRETSDPSLILYRLEQALQPDLENGRFVTMMIGALDTETHELKIVNAGQGPILHCPADGSAANMIHATGLPVGVAFESVRHESISIQLEPNDLFMMATDGIMEARDEANQLFGRARLQSMLEEFRHESAMMIVSRMREAVNEFGAPGSPADDMTMVMVRRVLD